MNAVWFVVYVCGVCVCVTLASILTILRFWGTASHILPCRIYDILELVLTEECHQQSASHGLARPPSTNFLKAAGSHHSVSQAQ